MTRRDQTIEAIFANVELLAELASSVEEAELADDLISLLDRSLAKYCDRKREVLMEKMASGGGAAVQGPVIGSAKKAAKAVLPPLAPVSRKSRSKVLPGHSPSAIAG